jgi:hypothetical protein
MICTPCGQPIEEGQLAIFGIERDGKLVFGWTCCHKPVGDVAVVLGSSVCVNRWLDEHREYIDAIFTLITNHRHARSQNDGHDS